MSRSGPKAIGSVSAWRDEMGRGLLNLDFRPLMDDRFWAAFKPLAGPLRIARTSLSPGLTFRDNELVRDGEDSFTLFMARRGRVCVTHQKREVVLRPGEATLLRNSETGTVGSPEPFTYDAILFPASELLQFAPGANELATRPIPASNEPLKLLWSYVGHLAKRPCRNAKLQAASRRHLFDIAAVLMSANEPRDAGPADESLQAVRFTAACAIVESGFGEPGLSVGGVAASLGISTRYLQRLFERQGVSFTQHLNEVRLKKAYALLSTSRSGGQRIIDVALAVGFSDISHFNRSFRRRFGEVPTEVRNHAASGN